MEAKPANEGRGGGCDGRDERYLLGNKRGGGSSAPDVAKWGGGDIGQCCSRGVDGLWGDMDLECKSLFSRLRRAMNKEAQARKGPDLRKN